MNRVILVDDEVFARQGLKNLIDWEQSGFVVCAEAENGEEALQIINETKPDLIITDIRMPVLDGLELIRAVRESGNSSAKFIIISGYNDFKYAQQAIKFGVQDFILKPIDEEELKAALFALHARMQKERLLHFNQKAYLDNTVLKQLLMGEYGEEDVEEIAKVLNLDKSAVFHYFIVEVNGLHTIMDDNGNGERLRQIRESVNKALAAACADQVQIHAYEQRAGVYGFLLPSRHHRQGSCNPEKLADQINHQLKREFANKICVYIGQPAARIGDIYESFSTANEVMQYKYAFPELHVYKHDSLKSQSLTYLEAEQAKLSALLEQLEEHDTDAMQSSVNCIFQEFQDKRFAPEAVKNSISKLVFSVIRAVNTMQGDEKELRSLRLLMQWPLYPMTLSELKDLFKAFILESSQMIIRLRKEHTKGDIGKIKAYIEAHFHENISLRSISGKFFMNSVYLGQLFKKTYGVYFNDFLLQIRIQKAKELLRQTELRIYEIAESVGFNNPDYFVIQFVKVEHKTPTEYRNALLAK